MPKELDSCVKQVKAKGGVDNAWAVCRASLGSDADIKRRKGKAGKQARKRKRKGMA